MALTQVSQDVLSSSQGNITQVGTLANLTVSGNIIADGIGIGTNSPGGDTNNKVVKVFGGGSGSFRAGAGPYTLTHIQYNGSAATVTDSDYYTLGTVIGGYVTVQTDGIERMRVDTSGNVGINTTAPTERLHVEGNVTISSNVKFTGWHVYESGTKLYFAYNGVNKMSLNTNGNLIVSGDITGFGTP